LKKRKKKKKKERKRKKKKEKKRRNGWLFPVVTYLDYITAPEGKFQYGNSQNAANEK
jgi:hypothetical protein